jgi:hypothetical protein
MLTGPISFLKFTFFLGIHKKKAFSDASVCLYIFDILYLNGETLLETPVVKRRKILKKHIKVFFFFTITFYILPKF